MVRWNSSIYEFNYKMRSIKEDEEIELSINSYGGDVFLGIDIGNTLKAHKGKVTVTITGIAASAASILCMGADVIKAYKNTQMMVHNAWTIVMGNAKELRKAADDLDSVGESVLASYTHRIDADTAAKLLDDETYLSASKALEYGLIDEIIDAEPEEVESEMFQDKAKEFNAKLSTKEQPVFTSTGMSEETLKQMFAEFKNEIKNELQPKEPEKTAPKQNLSALFLNLK